MLTCHPDSWLTAFIFAAQDYNWHSCYANAPPGLSCSRKKANESFVFLSLYVFHPMPHTFFLYLKTLADSIWRLASSPSSAFSSKSSPSGRTGMRTPLGRRTTVLPRLRLRLRLRLKVPFFVNGSRVGRAREVKSPYNTLDGWRALTAFWSIH